MSTQMTGTTYCGDCGGLMSTRAAVCVHCGGPITVPGNNGDSGEARAFNANAVTAFILALAYWPTSLAFGLLLQDRGLAFRAAFDLTYLLATTGLGIVGLRQIRATNERGRALAISALAILAAVLFLSVLLALVLLTLGV